MMLASIAITVLSGRPEMVSGGSALVAVNSVGDVRVTRNGEDVTASFKPANGQLVGLVDRLGPGKNRIEAAGKDGRARLDVVNHPITGPVFSGPHQTPFFCETEAAGLGSPRDAHCSAKTRVEYYYRSTEPVADSVPAAPSWPPRGYKRLDPAAARPSDIAGGLIIRREIGVINRAIYIITFRHDPAEPLPNPWSRGRWNGKLVYSFGGGCRAGYRQARVASGFDSSLLAEGYATAASSLNVFGNNCNDVLSAETMMMVKEHFIKNYGVPVFTIGSGGSGGSMQQHLIAQNYPGLLDGITPAASYPDIVSMVPPIMDCALLARAMEGGSQTWTEEQKTAVSGFATWKTCQSWIRSFSPALIRPGSCDSSIPESRRYDPVRNPKGVRCTLQDNLVNIFGRDSSGFARRWLDNVGVQYGLVAFNEGRISAEQFVELNERVGGYDADGNLVPQRTVADPAALRAAYETGRVNMGAGSLGSIPILDFRRYVDPAGDIHDSVRSLSTRARLTRANGSAANQVILTNPAGNAVRLMDQWLEAIARDTRGGGRMEKVARNKPAELRDACWTPQGERVTDAARCEAMFPIAGDPRMAAGGPLAGDVLKCALKPVTASGYQRPLTASQLARMKAVFPHGVCDYGKPGVEQKRPPKPWLSYD